MDDSGGRTLQCEGVTMSPTKWNVFTGRPDYVNEGSGPGGLAFEWIQEAFTASAGQTVFVLSFAPIVDSETVFVNGMAQIKGASEGYTLAGTTLTIDEPLKAAPSGPDRVLIKYTRLTP